MTLQVQPSYSGSALQPSYSPAPPARPTTPAAVLNHQAEFQEEAQEDKYGIPLAPVYHSRIGLLSNNEEEEDKSTTNKRESLGMLIGEPPVYTQSMGVPDIWNMFSNEWGSRLTKRKANLDI